VIVAHVDLDAFFAAVEELDRPELRTQPLIVGGDPHGRGVVATANYEARRYGIHSAMSSAEALRRCRHAVFLRPRHSHYRDVSRRVWAAIREVTPVVEQTGIDEGYLDLSEQATDFLGARALAEAVQTAVRGTTQLTCSLGVAQSKVVAKIASDRRKPAGITVVPAGREAAFLAELPVRKLPGVGPKAEGRLRAAGVTTIGALAALDDPELGTLLPGKVGVELRERALGIDRRRVQPASEPPVSISNEETFDRDVDDRARLHDELRGMATNLEARLRERGLYARTVTTKLRYDDFTTRTRSETMGAATDDGSVIGELACVLLDRALEQRAAPLRLVGVGVSGLEPVAQLALVAEHEPQAEAQADALAPKRTQPSSRP
jgi:DNA polymerase IV